MFSKVWQMSSTFYLNAFDKDLKECWQENISSTRLKCVWGGRRRGMLGITLKIGSGQHVISAQIKWQEIIEGMKLRWKHRIINEVEWCPMDCKYSRKRSDRRWRDEIKDFVNSIHSLHRIDSLVFSSTETLCGLFKIKNFFKEIMI